MESVDTAWTTMIATNSWYGLSVTLIRSAKYPCTSVRNSEPTLTTYNKKSPNPDKNAILSPWFGLSGAWAGVPAGQQRTLMPPCPLISSVFLQRSLLYWLNRRWNWSWCARWIYLHWESWSMQQPWSIFLPSYSALLLSLSLSVGTAYCFKCRMQFISYNCYILMTVQLKFREIIVVIIFFLFLRSAMCPVHILFRNGTSHYYSELFLSFPNALVWVCPGAPALEWFNRGLQPGGIQVLQDSGKIKKHWIPAIIMPEWRSLYIPSDIFSLCSSCDLFYTTYIFHGDERFMKVRLILSGQL